MPNDRQPPPDHLVLLGWDATHQRPIPTDRLDFATYNAGTDPQYVVCLRTRDLPTPDEPSIRDVCPSCLSAIWVGRSTEAAMTRMARPTLVCLDCARPLLQLP